METICDQNTCCGCRACENICPQKAITMVADSKGFLYPKINKDLCIECNLCKEVCPFLNTKQIKTPLKIYACKNKNQKIRNTSSSGGTFQEISNLVLKQNGSIYGAGFTNKHTVEHVRATTLEELENIKGSKYVQSDMKQVFKHITNDLNDDKTVLFSGTPCQVSAIKNFDINNSNNLILVDVVCHGVPSPKIFEDYKKYLETTYNSTITKINFRHKDKESTQNIKIDFANNQSYISNVAKNDFFYYLFLKDIILRDSCYNCEYKNFSRIGDISLADFWGYSKGPAKDFGDNKGVSLVLINTQKGLEIFNQIKENLDCFEISKEDCYPYNCFSNFKIPEFYNDFWNEYLKNGFEASVNKYIEKK